MIYLSFVWCHSSINSLNYESNGKSNIHVANFQLNGESFVLLFHTHFISLDPTNFTFPLETTASTEPRLALRWISSVNYSTCIPFLRV